LDNPNNQDMVTAAPESGPANQPAVPETATSVTGLLGLAALALVAARRRRLAVA
jgi:MYXO-CTERM domain-containing protein